MVHLEVLPFEMGERSRLRQRSCDFSLRVPFCVLDSGLSIAEEFLEMRTSTIHSGQARKGKIGNTVKSGKILILQIKEH